MTQSLVSEQGSAYDNFDQLLRKVDFNGYDIGHTKLSHFLQIQLAALTTWIRLAHLIQGKPGHHYHFAELHCGNLVKRFCPHKDRSNEMD